MAHRFAKDLKRKEIEIAASSLRLTLRLSTSLSLSLALRISIKYLRKTLPSYPFVGAAFTLRVASQCARLEVIQLNFEPSIESMRKGCAENECLL